MLESAAVASPHPTRHEIVKAFIVLSAEYAAHGQDKTKSLALIAELQAFCREHSAPYKYPREIEFIAAADLPKTVSGKIRRGELKALEYEVSARLGFLTQSTDLITRITASQGCSA